MDEQLLKHFLEPTPIEVKQLKNHKFYNDYDKKTFIGNPLSKIPVFSEQFFIDQPLYISKHSRFAPYPEHTHTFMEINYVLKGEVTETINNEKITLHAGDFLLLDSGTSHSIEELKYSDIMLNIDFHDSSINFKKLQNLGESDNLNSLFLANMLSHNFLIFYKDQSEPRLRELANLIIEEYFSSENSSYSIISSLTHSFLLMLVRNINISSIKFNDNNQRIIYRILTDIRDNYSTVSLSSLSEKYNYNRNYLSNLFKQTIGKSFSSVLLEKKLSVAYYLLLNSKLSIAEIAEESGFSNMTFFYKKFKELYNTTPHNVNKKN
ncbi:AraC-like DNA-binding protein/mannose-6-phosphate isomerase-like protein (cupin superfamily) [Lactobacillus colini]|uniref:AraC-like DNA-binding protein/mannose-6-phosphate isomerase-like protein (Cupin superfamily) n=1 Tax=Lactobacillus colini TaxID=1819254 RepID=A0ABS4MES8_9LACO|nr:AraC family transcriptional regulator [Lactobacillus colini]MBP2058193.1 AraC-like DNA-binding protein/mannose-6-phosphate isomerase-like protein (cupin superfamily) [Lactobacillus colini]